MTVAFAMAYPDITSFSYSYFFIADPPIAELLASSNPNSHALAYYKIGEEKQTKYIKTLFNNPGDPHIISNFQFYTMSLYSIKMNAMRKISGLEPNKRIDMRDVDTTIIEFYRDWAITEGYLVETK